MLFKKLNCPKCNSYYDEHLDACPNCGNPNNEQKVLAYKNNILWLDYVKQLIVFAIGFAFFQILSAVLSLILLRSPSSNEIFNIMLVNLISYLTTLLISCLCLFKDRRIIFNNCANTNSVVIGIISSVILVGGSMLLSFLFGLIYKSTNVNQSIAQKLIVNYPAFGFLILGLVGPLIEELTYRVGLFSFSSRINRIFAYIITVLFFTIIHIDFSSADFKAELISLPTYMFAAFVLSFTYEKGGLTSSFISHSLNNILSVVLILLGVNI